MNVNNSRPRYKHDEAWMPVLKLAVMVGGMTFSKHAWNG